jgi:ribonuclease III
MAWGVRVIRRLLTRTGASEEEIHEIASQALARDKLRKLRLVLGYRIRNREIFVQALLHRSYPQKSDRHHTSNERMEFLGDSVLNFIVAEYLYNRHPKAREGELTKMRSRLVNRKALAAYAKAINLSDLILMSASAAQSIGKGYETIMGDTFEALVAALYMDGGFSAAKRFVEKQIQSAVRDGSVVTVDENYKSRLLEFTQSHGLGVPRYVIAKEEGPDHDRTFTIDVLLRSVRKGSGSGKNKKDAEQAAARQALANLS